jgi:hypothetical protein
MTAVVYTPTYLLCVAFAVEFASAPMAHIVLSVSSTVKGYVVVFLLGVFATAAQTWPILWIRWRCRRLLTYCFKQLAKAGEREFDSACGSRDDDWAASVPWIMAWRAVPVV